MIHPVRLFCFLLAVVTFAGCASTDSTTSLRRLNRQPIYKLDVECTADWFSLKIDSAKARFVLSHDTWVHVPQADLENFNISDTTVQIHRKRWSHGLVEIKHLYIQSAEPVVQLAVDHGANGKVTVRTVTDHFEDGARRPHHHRLELSRD